jgi:hypothetical protein
MKDYRVCLDRSPDTIDVFPFDVLDAALEQYHRSVITEGEYRSQSPGVSTISIVHRMSGTILKRIEIASMLFPKN